MRKLDLNSIDRRRSQPFRPCGVVAGVGQVRVVARSVSYSRGQRTRVWRRCRAD